MNSRKFLRRDQMIIDAMVELFSFVVQMYKYEEPNILQSAGELFFG